MRELRSRFGVNDGGILLTVGLAVVLIYQLLLGVAVDATTQTYLWAYSFVAPVLFLLAATVGARLMGVNPLEAIPVRRKLQPAEAGRIVLLAILAILAFLPLATGIQWVFGKMGYHATPTYADYSSTWWRMLLGLVALAALPALGEEFLVRGALFGSLKSKGTVYAILLSSLVFGLMHGSPVQFIHQFLIGCIMAYIVYRTECIWGSVLFHFVNNAVVILYEFVYHTAGATYTIPWWVYLIMFVVATPLLVWVLWTDKKKYTDATGNEIPMVAAPSLGKGGAFWASRGEYVPYQRQPKPIGLYVAIALTGVIWLVNTIVEWRG